MKSFMGADFLLGTETAEHLFNEYSKNLPIIDYHCHINPREIYEDRMFNNITEVWLGGDHYKWRAMRACGVEEKYITGDGSDRDKFQKYAETLEVCIGNPLFQWSHLELQRYFGYNGMLNGDTAEEVWQLANEKLRTPEFSARNLIRRSNVEIICTTDDPVDSLEWHQKLYEEKDLGFKVYPAWRPDKAMNINLDTFIPYVKTLEEVSGVEITSFKTLVDALYKRMEFFNSMGTRISDHGLDYVPCKPASEEEIEAIFDKKMKGEELTALEVSQYKTAFLAAMCSEYYKYGWILQLHYGCKRNNNTSMFEKLGPDTGYDASDNYTPSAELADFLDMLNQKGILPKTILYSLTPYDNQLIDTIMGCFQNSDAFGKMQHGSAWWFNDHAEGMNTHMKALASIGVLGTFVGMLTDSRSFLSYPRHELFRRIMCNLIGEYVENGEYPNDERCLKRIVEGISYYNAKNYFEFK